MQDLGDKLRIVVTAHRRIKITSQMLEDLEENCTRGRLSNILNGTSEFVKYV